MSENPYTVYVIVDPHFGERLSTLPSGTPVWIVDTPENKRFAQQIRRELPQPSHLTAITTYTYSENSSPEENFLKELDMIDLHHSLRSADPPFTRIEVFGTPLSNKIKVELADYGFHSFAVTTDGFIATRLNRPTQT